MFLIFLISQKKIKSYVCLENKATVSTSRLDTEKSMVASVVDAIIVKSLWEYNFILLDIWPWNIF